MPPWFDALDPLAQRLVLAGAGFILLVLVLSIWGRRRESRRAARARAELRQGMAQVRLQQAEVKRLGQKIIATSSTSRIAGFAIVRQVETVFSDGEKSSELAVDHVKARAAHKGGNALVNLQTQKGTDGKWFASGDAVIVRSLARAAGRPAAPAPTDKPQNQKPPPWRRPEDGSRS